MNFEELKTNLPIYFSLELAKKVEEKIDSFKGDRYVLGILEAFVSKDLRALTFQDTYKPYSVIESIVVQNFPVDDPLKYAVFYTAGAENNRLERFEWILHHTNLIKKIDSSLPSLGLVKNNSFNVTNQDIKIDFRPYLLEPKSYLNFLYDIMMEDANKANSLIDIGTRFNGFEKHINDLKESGLDVKRIMSLNYSNLIKTLDETENKKDTKKFEEQATRAVQILKALDQRDLIIYDTKMVNLMLEWWKNRSFTEELNLIKGLSKETLMYCTGLHAKPEVEKK